MFGRSEASSTGGTRTASREKARVTTFEQRERAAAAAAREARAPKLSGGILFRWLARRAPGVAGAVLALACFLAIPGLGLDTDRHPWVLPLRAAAVTATALCLAAYLWLPRLHNSVCVYSHSWNIQVYFFIESDKCMYNCT